MHSKAVVARAAPSRPSRRGRPAHPEAAQERRRALVEAALAVIARDGLAATSTRAIAAEAQLNLAALHYYFPNKDAVLWAVLELILRQVDQVLAEATSGAASLRQGLRRAVEAYWKHVLQTPQLQRVQYELTINALTAPDGADYARRQYQGYIGTVEAALTRLKGSNRAPDLRHLAGVCVAAIDGLILQYLATRDRARCQAQLELIIRSLEALCT